MAVIKDEFLAWASKSMEAGDGLHTDIYIAVCFLLNKGYEGDDVFDIIRHCADGVEERNVPDREIKSAIIYAQAREEGIIIGNKWSSSDPLLMAEVVKSYPVNLDLLREKMNSFNQNPSSFLPQLFKEDELLCVAADTWTYATIYRDEVCEISATYALEFIVPSAMTSKTGTTVEGKVSAHTKDNTGERIYLVVEFDQASTTDQFSFHKYLSSKMPLVLMLHSGGKSIHGWYYVEGREDEEIKSFFDLACQLGADRKTWTPSQFIRLPAGRNNKHNKTQQVIYFNPIRK